MPGWWKSKVKSKPRPSSASSSPRHPNGDVSSTSSPPGSPVIVSSHVLPTKEKSYSLDEPRSGSGSGSKVRPHPLPRPTYSPLPSPPALSASVSSNSSSVSSDDAVDPGIYRCHDQIILSNGRITAPSHEPHLNMTDEKNMLSCSTSREQSRNCDVSALTTKEVHLRQFDLSTIETTPSPDRLSVENIFGSRTRSPSPSSRLNFFSASPAVHTVPFGFSPRSPNNRQDGMKSPTHPLPLPPSSPGCTSHSFHSKWRKGKLLGKGTFGHVYVGFNSENGQMCAIKEVEVISDDSNSRESLRQLNQEISLLSQLSHPNIVQYYGSELVDDTLSVYLEYVSGGSIHKLLQEYGPFSEPVIQNYTRQILSGLTYLHGRNTVHRDIKGANILVGTNGEVKLADFGMAKHISAYASMRSFKGSSYWMAPEVIMNGNGYNLSVDIWSLGCTIIEMATSKPPWHQFEGAAAIFKIANSRDAPEVPESISPCGKHFLQLCLQRDPAARPTAAKLMEHPYIRDLPAIRSVRSAPMDMHPSSGSRCSNKITQSNQADFSARRSLSPLHNIDVDAPDLSGFSLHHPSSFTNTSCQTSSRSNLSLPASPCSSPLRQFRQSNWSCLPSPSHTSYSPVAADGRSSYPANHTKSKSSCAMIDIWTTEPAELRR